MAVTALAATALAATALAIPALAAPAGAATRPADRAATHTYLLDRIAYVEARLAGESKAVAAERTAAARIAGECPGVLGGAPTMLSSITEGGVGNRPNTKRQGEQERRLDQITDLDEEIDASVEAGPREQLGVLERQFQERVATLRWSDPRIASAIQLRIQISAILYAEPSPANICADLRYWAASGFMRIPEATKQARIARETAVLPLSGLVHSALIDSPPATLMKRFEGSSERALVKKLVKLETQKLSGESSSDVLRNVRKALGSKEAKLAELERPAIEVGTGKTHLGGTFTVKVEKPRPHEHPACHLRISLEGGAEMNGPEQLVQVVSGGSSDCVPLQHRLARSEVSCNNGLLQIEALLPSSVRSVRLRLSDGHTITSRTVLVPKRFGRALAVYYQELRGPRPTPVGLTELDGAGKEVGSVKLERREPGPCRRQVTRNAVIVQGTVPAGGGFVIGGEDTVGEASSFDTSIQSVDPIPFSESPLFTPGRGAFEVRIAAACGASPYAVLYGRLLRAGATVQARLGSTFVTLTNVSLPPSLHASGELAYAVLPDVPTEIVVRAGDGKVIQKIPYAETAQRHRQYCEGFNEPPGS